MNKSVQKAKELTHNDKLEYLSKYLNRYIDDCIEKYTSSKEKLENLIADNTLIGLIVYVIDCDEARQKQILKYLQAPFEINMFTSYDYRNEVNHILYDLIIKEDRS